MIYHIPELISRTIETFTKSSTDLLTVTNSEVISVAHGDKQVYYGKIFAKPSKRLQRLLTIENEILILVSSFKDQQFRTVAQVKDLIDKSGGRLEATVAIIIHKDPTGDNKLKKWGRQKGISILPLYNDDREFPKGEKLESILLTELYSHDPFDITGPVSEDSQFYGRRTEAIDLSRKLVSGQIRSCLGIRKIGKTSLLNRVLYELDKQKASKSFIIDCSKDHIWSMTAAKLMTSIADAVLKSLTNFETQTVVNESTENLTIQAATNKLLKAVNSTEIPILIFFDEVDYITPGSPTGIHWSTEFNIFWRNFRAVYQDVCRFNHNLGIFISGVSSKWFSVESINGIENAALAFVPEEYLSPLPKGASEQMIKILARTSGLQFDDKVAAIIADYCCDIPYWIRKASSFIHRRIPFESRPYKVSDIEANRILNEFLETEGGVLSRVALMHLMKVYPELKEPTLKVSEGTGKDVQKRIMNILDKYGVTKVTSGSQVINGAMMREGVKLLNELEDETEIQAAQTPDNDEKKIQYDTYDEWADELAILNRERNNLEKKLRGIAINFIRLDSLTNKNRGSATDRILKAIPTEKRDQFNSLSPEQIVEKYHWLELVKLIEKEWTIFEKLFNDKNAFNVNSSVVNQRLDAHAKDADRADVALQRNAIRWFDDKIRLV